MLLRLSPSPIGRVLRNVVYTPGRDLRLTYRIELDADDYPLGTLLVSAILVAEPSFGLAPLLARTITAADAPTGQITDTGADGVAALHFALTPSDLIPLASGPMPFEVIVEDSLGRQATLDIGSLVPTPSTVGAPVDRVTVLPEAFSLTAPNTTTLTATAYDVDGNVLTGRILNWTSSDPLTASIDPVSGLVTAIGEGAVLFTATVEGKSDSATGTIIAGVDTVTVTPDPVTVLVGETQQMTAVARDIHGTVLPGQIFVWVSSDPAIATVNQAGLVTPLTYGVVTITATTAGHQGTASVTVPTLVQWFRTVQGGDGTLRYLSSVSINLTQGAGGDGHQRMTALQDARGNTFGQTYTPSTVGNGAEVVGAGTSLELQSTNSSDMRTPAVASDVVGPMTYYFVGGFSRNAPGGLSFPFGYSSDDLATSLILTQADGSAQKGGYEIISNPGALYTHSAIPRDGRPRLIKVTIDATGLLSISSPASATAAGPVYTRQLAGNLGATAVRRFFGGIGGFAALSGEGYRMDAALNRVATAADDAIAIRGAKNFHKAINGSKVRIYLLGTSLDAGYAPTLGVEDLSKNWITLMLAGVAFNGAKPYYPLNFAVTGAWYRSGTNAGGGGNVVDNQLPLLTQHYDFGADLNIVVLGSGATNDLASNDIAYGFTDAGATATKSFLDCCDLVRAIDPTSRLKIVVVPCTPRNAVGGAGGQARFDTDRATFTANLAAQYAAHADQYASELLTIAPFNVANGYTDPLYIDGIHEGDYTKRCQGIQPAVLRIAVP
jgi:uncharacterized protein YjdB